MRDPDPPSPVIAVNVKRIALCHLESLTCLPALNHVFESFGDRIGLVLISRRFATAHGGFFTQLAASVRASGVPMTFWLGFDLISAQVVAVVAPLLRFIARPKLQSLSSLARRHGAVLVETGDINAPEALNVLRVYSPDVLLVINFDQILRPPTIAIPRLGTLNVHPSLLPDLRGPCPVFWALAEGRAISGATIHCIEDARIDAGTILCQAQRPIDARNCVAEINTDLFLAGAGMLGEALEGLSSGRIVGPPVAEQYKGFPTRGQVAKARRRGVRLCRFRYAARLIAAAMLPIYWRSLNGKFRR